MLNFEVSGKHFNNLFNMVLSNEVNNSSTTTI